MDAIFENYTNTVSDEEDKRLLFTAIDEWNVYMNYHDQMLEMAQAGKDREARILFGADAKESYDRVSDCLLYTSGSSMMSEKSWGQRIFWFLM